MLESTTCDPAISPLPAEGKQHLLIVGNGMATTRLLEELGQRKQDYDITVLSGEVQPYYNRIMLSPLLAGETQLDDITPYKDTWYAERCAYVLLNHRVRFIHHCQQRVECDNGAIFRYDKLVLATGSRPFIPKLPTHSSSTLPSGVIGFRDLDDIAVMEESVAKHTSAVVVGAGLLGIEAADALAKKGMRVRLLHRSSILMNRQIDAVSSGLLHRHLQRRGIQVLVDEEIKSFIGKQHISAVELKSGVTLGTELVVFATGIQPNIELAKHTGLDTNQGIIVNARMQTSETSIYSLGECTEFEQTTYGLVAPIWKQASVLADNLCGITTHYTEQDHVIKLKVSGIDVHAFGQIHPQTHDETLTFYDPSAGVYKKIILHNNIIKGALLFGDIKDSLWYERMAQQAAPINELRPFLLFGEQHCQHL